jgi:hypothetical protein
LSTADAASEGFFIKSVSAMVIGSMCRINGVRASSCQSRY